MDQLFEQILAFLPLFATAAGVVAFLLVLNWLILGRHPELGNERRLPRQLVMLGFTLAGVVAVILALPVEPGTRNQVIALVGVLASGIIAFSSTTMVANLMAGIMLRVNRPFGTGDFIHVEDHFGRVVERGLLDTEIQNERRELIAVPNTYLISKPVVVVRSPGAIVSATLSLGYDVHHSRIETFLSTAAQETGLTEPFVQILELGNYSITYRVNGLLADVKSILTTRSNLYKKILDILHREGVEIVSPSFMNQRRLAEGSKILPRPAAEAPADDSARLEEIVFDKAEQAEHQEEIKQRLQNEVRELKERAKAAAGDDKRRIADLAKEKLKQLQELSRAQPETPELPR